MSGLPVLFEKKDKRVDRVEQLARNEAIYGFGASP
jgi:hypothetical protein